MTETMTTDHKKVALRDLSVGDHIDLIPLFDAIEDAVRHGVAGSMPNEIDRMAAETEYAIVEAVEKDAEGMVAVVTDLCEVVFYEDFKLDVITH